MGEDCLALISQLRALEEHAARGRDFALAGSAVATQERLAKALADINVIEENERSAVSNKDYSAAAQLKEEGDNAKASLAADIKAAKAEFAAQISAIPVAQPAAPQQALTPVVAVPVGLPAGNQMRERLLDNDMQNPVAYQQQHAPLQPAVAPTTLHLVRAGIDSHVPPGAPPGGHWIMDKYCGVVTTLLAIFVCCCVCCCPCDEREVYVSPDGRKFSRNGALVSDSC